MSRLRNALDLMDEAGSTGAQGREATGAQAHRATGSRAPEEAQPRVPESMGARAHGASGARAGKRGDPDRDATKILFRVDTKKKAKRLAEDKGYADFSDLVQELVEQWLEKEGGNDG